MPLLITKASDDYWYKIDYINTIDALIKKYDDVIIERNTYTTKEDFDFWDGMKAKDIPTIMKCKYHVIIYDSYVEQKGKENGNYNCSRAFVLCLCPLQSRAYSLGARLARAGA